MPSVYVNNLCFSRRLPLFGWPQGGAIVRRLSWVFGTVLEESYRAEKVISNTMAQKGVVLRRLF